MKRYRKFSKSSTLRTAATMSLKSLLLFTPPALALALALGSLTACGGGGSDSTSPSPGTGGGTTPPSADVVPVSGTLQANAGTSTYTAASLEADAFAVINAARQAAGAGVVVQSAQMDAAAKAHADYLTANPEDSHYEDAAKSGFYAYSPADRVAKAGFSAGFVNEVIGGTGVSLKGSDCILGLLNTVYHAAAILSPVTNVGVGFGQDAIGVPRCVADFATAASESFAQVAPAGELVAYPYSGQTGVLETFYVAYERPRPSATLFPNTTAGTPVVVNVRNADFVNFKAAGTLAAVVTKFELKDAGGNAVPVGILANSGITGSGLMLTADANLGEGFVVLVPLSPLAKGVTYTASVTATLKAGGTPVTRAWSFTTANS